MGWDYFQLAFYQGPFPKCSTCDLVMLPSSTRTWGLLIVGQFVKLQDSWSKILSWHSFSWNSALYPEHPTSTTPNSHQCLSILRCTSFMLEKFIILLYLCILRFIKELCWTSEQASLYLSLNGTLVCWKISIYFCTISWQWRCTLNFTQQEQQNLWKFWGVEVCWWTILRWHWLSPDCTSILGNHFLLGQLSYNAYG